MRQSTSGGCPALSVFGKPPEKGCDRSWTVGAEDGAGHAVRRGNSHAIPAHGEKRILIRQIVAEEDRADRPVVPFDPATNPRDGASLVPDDARQQLERFRTAHHTQLT